MRACPRFFCATESVVTVYAHALGVVPTISVRTAVDLSLVRELAIRSFLSNELTTRD